MYIIIKNIYLYVLLLFFTFLQYYHHDFKNIDYFYLNPIYFFFQFIIPNIVICII